MTVPYTPTAFASPIVNPVAGGVGTVFPYLSVSQYQYAPTAIDTSDLVQNGTEDDQIRSLADTIRRASRWADRIVYGFDASTKAASLCATESVENSWVRVIQGELRLICDYKPIVIVQGIDVGTDPSNVSTIGASLAAQTRIGRRTLYVPFNNSLFNRNGEIPVQLPPVPLTRGMLYAVWSYVCGFPHTQLTANVTHGTNTCDVAATDGSTGLLGILPGFTQFTIKDGAQTESFVVESVSGTTITATTDFEFDHVVPDAPDFLPVTALPDDVEEALILLTTALIKTRGDNSLVLDEIHEPDRVQATAGGVSQDVVDAMNMLAAFKTRVKAKR